MFQASLCLVIYNLLQVVRGYAAQASPEPVKVNDLSTEKIFLDVHEELVGLHRVLKGAAFFEVLPRADSTEAVRARLRELLGRAWTPIAAVLAVWCLCLTIIGFGWFQYAAGGYGGTKEKIIGVSVLGVSILLFLFRQIVQEHRRPHWREDTPSVASLCHERSTISG